MYISSCFSSSQASGLAVAQLAIVGHSLDSLDDCSSCSAPAAVVVQRCVYVVVAAVGRGPCFKS